MRSSTMRRVAETPQPISERPSLYDEVTSRIIGELEQGRLPWVQPWGQANALSPGLPRNALTGRAYSGVNILILWGTVIEQSYPSQDWLTFRQAQDAGGCVRKGEKGTTIVYADRFIPQAEKSKAAQQGEDAKSIPFLKRFTVFNLAQCEGLRPGLAPQALPLPEREVVPLAEAVIEASGIEVRVGGDKAYYVPSQDYIAVPPQQAFFQQINYYRTCLHEVCNIASVLVSRAVDGLCALLLPQNRRASLAISGRES
ncbi:ArdC family protein [Sphingobium sp. BS19]|uniref:ArdC family protein n=1 Tax=Sphingobium sp. BS19 TaxID=3018973 RepID=UPI0022EF29CD|nr:ArdC-like ssDNA-binding domain-containing protein [Sphingobium sp. BS19]GLI99083.1 hypothetical protein Sbs19_29010 [Sphingobium sp. BS19]